MRSLSLNLLPLVFIFDCVYSTLLNNVVTCDIEPRLLTAFLLNKCIDLSNFFCCWCFYSGIYAARRDGPCSYLLFQNIKEAILHFSGDIPVLCVRYLACSVFVYVLEHALHLLALNRFNIGMYQPIQLWLDYCDDQYVSSGDKVIDN